MSWSFTGNAESSLDQVRLQIGDFNPDRQLVEDEVIVSSLEQHQQDVQQTSIAVLGYLVALYTTYGKVVVGRWEFDATYMVKLFQLRINQLSTGITLYSSNLLWAGGIEAGERELAGIDHGLISGRFSRGQFDNKS